MSSDTPKPIDHYPMTWHTAVEEAATVEPAEWIACAEGYTTLKDATKARRRFYSLFKSLENYPLHRLSRLTQGLEFALTIRFGGFGERHIWVRRKDEAFDESTVTFLLGIAGEVSAKNS